MMKPKMMVHGSLARCISDPAEQERLLRQGWLFAAPKPKTKTAKSMRSLRARRRADGWKTLILSLSPEHVIVVKEARHPGESYAELLIRLIKNNVSAD